MGHWGRSQRGCVGIARRNIVKYSSILIIAVVNGSHPRRGVGLWVWGAGGGGGEMKIWRRECHSASWAPLGTPRARPPRTRDTPLSRAPLSCAPSC